MSISIRRISACLLQLGLIALLVLPGFRAALAAAPANNRQAVDFNAVDRFVQAEMKKHGLKGAALAITEGDQIVYAQGYGEAARGRPMTPDTPLYIGSMSKAITGAALLQQVEQGRVRLDEPVITYLPWFRLADDEAAQTLTVGDFAHHISGLSDAGFDTLPPADASPAEAARMLATARQTQPARTKTQYFNMNYLVIAQVVEAVSGESYPEYVQKHIFDPLGMTHSFTDPVLAKQNGLAQGYSRVFPFSVPKQQPFRAYDLSTGYIMSSASDMAHLLVAMNNQGSYQGQQLLTPDSVRLSRAPAAGVQGFSYGIGWFMDSFNGVPRIQHGGALETFKSQMAYYPNSRRGVVMLTNQGSLFDSYISAQQLFDGVETLVTGTGSPQPSRGISVPVIGWGLLLIFAGLMSFMSWQVSKLPQWPALARQMSPARRAVDIGLHFLIPTVILYFVFSGLAAFLGYRFNLWQQVSGMFLMMPDMMLLAFVGTVPDYIQGLVKLGMLLFRKV